MNTLAPRITLLLGFASFLFTLWISPSESLYHHFVLGPSLMLLFGALAAIQERRSFDQTTSIRICQLYCHASELQAANDAST
ncbi:MAG: hypothetical protein HWE11_00410, partial [Gammaproteobacteria bacterium]|nr:hypothetical protein [Gammaproteobacteria bacterium]